MPHKLRCAVALAAGLICSFAASVPAHPPSIVTGEQEKAMSEEIIAWRKEFAHVVEQKDAARLSFVHTHGPGKHDGRDARIVSVLAGEPVIETAQVDDLVTRVPGGWTSVATGKSPRTARPISSHGSPFTCASTKAGNWLPRRRRG